MLNIPAYMNHAVSQNMTM